MFFEKKEYSDFVDLSDGRVYIKPITNGMRNKIFIKSTIIGTTLNNNLFFDLWEKKLTVLSNSKLNKLDLKDGDKLKAKIKEILKRHNIIEDEKIEETEENLFSLADKKVFENQLSNVKQKFGVK